MEDVMKDRTMYRQGDVLLIGYREKDGVKADKEAKLDGGRAILAYGEVTGHAHALNGRDVALMEGEREDSDKILAVKKSTSLKHEEHAAIPLRRGEKYIVRRQMEYSQTEMGRTVAD